MDSSSPTPSGQILDCRGLVCPAPILEIAEVVRRQGADLGTLVVLATDVDFPEDVEAWCRSTGATLLRMDHQPDGTIRAKIRVKHAGSPASISVAPTAIATKANAARRRSSVAASTTRSASTAWNERSPRSISRGALVVGTSEPQGAFQGSAALALRAPSERPVPMLASLPTLAEDSYPPSLPRNVHTLVSRRPESMAGLAAQDQALQTAALPREHRAALLVLHNDLEALLAALTIANASAAQGMRVELYFSFWGIHLLRAERRRAKKPGKEGPSLLQRVLLWLVPRGTKQSLGKLHLGGLGTRILLRLMRKRNMMALEQLLHAAGSLGVRFRVCSASMDLMGLEEEDILEMPNVDFVGAACFAEAAARASVNLVF